MKTTKTNQITNLEIATYYKSGYSYKMGGTQTVVMPDGEEFKFDDREWYSGRGKKWNSSIRHEIVGIVKITKKQVATYKKMIADRKKELKARILAQKIVAKRILEAKKNGVYSLITFDYGTFVELSNEESQGRFFDVGRLAKTLDISVEDANLLNSKGKTYVFAKKSNGEIIELYHSSLFCNSLSISVSTPSAERIAEFKNEANQWHNARYSDEVGNTGRTNHFVC